MATETRDSARADVAELSYDTAAILAEEEHGPIQGRSPWYLAWRRLRRNYVALFSLFIFLLIVLACALAPVYAKHVAHSNPYTNHVTDTVKVNGKEVSVISAGGTFTDPKLNPAIMAVGGVEARHANLLAQVLGSLGDPSAMPVPKAFQVTDKAVMAGTGVG